MHNKKKHFLRRATKGSELAKPSFHYLKIGAYYDSESSELKRESFVNKAKRYPHFTIIIVTPENTPSEQKLNYEKSHQANKFVFGSRLKQQPNKWNRISLHKLGILAAGAQSNTVLSARYVLILIWKAK